MGFAAAVVPVIKAVATVASIASSLSSKKGGGGGGSAPMVAPPPAPADEPTVDPTQTGQTEADRLRDIKRRQSSSGGSLFGNADPNTKVPTLFGK